MNKLVGRKILALEMNEEKDDLRFTTDEGIYTFEAWGDCCSRSWVENISYLHELLRFEVLKVEEIDLPTEDIDSGCIQKMIYKLHTEAGDCLLEMRNESNGYYYGCIQDREPLNAEELKKMPLKPVMGDV